MSFLSSVTSPAFLLSTPVPTHRSTNAFLHPHRRHPIRTAALPPRCFPPTCMTEAEPPTPPPAPDPIAFSTAASSATTLNAALREAAARALANLPPGGPPDLALVFVSVRYSVSNVGQTGRHSMSTVVPRLRALIPELRSVIGCTTDGVIGTGPTGDVVELEDAPALSLTLARMPGIRVRTFHVMPDDLPSLDARQSAWRALVNQPDPAQPSAFIVLSDPSFAERGELNTFLSGVEYAYPASTVVGSLASTGAAFPQGHMFCTLPRDVLSFESASLRDSGLVGISLIGDVQLDCLVSPGCRPIGPVFEVRKVAANGVLRELELVGRPSSALSAVGQLKSIISYATPVERRLIQNDLHIGIAIDQLNDGDGSNDYLIRHVIGVDMDAGSIAVNQNIRPGQRIRFFVKERETAQETLDTTMQKYKRTELANSMVGYSNPPFGAMVFVDAGRGRQLFREPVMETRNLVSFASGVPVSGFFAGGQIGPCRSDPDGVSGPSVLHNAANLIALVRRRSGMSPAEPIDSPSTSTKDLDDKSGQ